MLVTLVVPVRAGRQPAHPPLRHLLLDRDRPHCRRRGRRRRAGALVPGQPPDADVSRTDDAAQATTPRLRGAARAAASRRATSPTSTMAERLELAEGGRAAGVPRPAALHALLPAAGRRPRADDRPAGRPARRAGVDVPARADDAAAHPRGRPRHHPQDAVEALRRRAGRVGADALPRPGHDVRLQPGRLRDGLPVLRHRPGRAAAQHVHRRDRRAGASPAPGRSTAARCPAGRAGSPTSSSWAWASRWPTTRP